MYGPTAATRDGPVCCPAWPSEGCCSVKEKSKEMEEEQKFIWIKSVMKLPKRKTESGIRR